MRAEDLFLQDPPRLTNTYEADASLPGLLERLLPADAHSALREQWRSLGDEAAGPLAALAREAESDPPRHVPYDAWGRRVDHIELSPAWTRLQAEAARWGLYAAPYEKGLGEYARLHHAALIVLFAPSSAIATCPVAMTDGAARTLLEHDAGLAARVVPRFTTRDPAALWTCGQWMTERSGGSDVGNTETVARPDGEGGFRLSGVKWFTSAVTSEAALTLARIAGEAEGSAGLSLFFLEQRLAGGALNGIRVERLKDKLGTRALPTAELTLDGTRAQLVGGAGHGVRKVAPLLNTTRLHNALNACGIMARLLQLLRDYAHRRVAFGEPLAQKPLHRETLAELQVEYDAALALTFECLRLLGRVEAGTAGSSEAARLRLLTPVAKLATARQAVAAASEALEGFGGAGYVEDTGLPVWLRDAQVLPIWEGTTNVLSLDVLRAALRDGVLAPWAEDARARLAALRTGPTSDAAAALSAYLDRLLGWLEGVAALGRPLLEAGARRFALGVAATAAGIALCEQGAWEQQAGRSVRATWAARRWAARRLPPLPPPGESIVEAGVSGVLSGL